MPCPTIFACLLNISHKIPTSQGLTRYTNIATLFTPIEVASSQQLILSAIPTVSHLRIYSGETSNCIFRKFSVFTLYEEHTSHSLLSSSPSQQLPLPYPESPSCCRLTTSKFSLPRTGKHSHNTKHTLAKCKPCFDDRFSCRQSFHRALTLNLSLITINTDKMKQH